MAYFLSYSRVISTEMPVNKRQVAQQIHSHQAKLMCAKHAELYKATDQLKHNQERNYNKSMQKTASKSTII